MGRNQNHNIIFIVMLKNNQNARQISMNSAKVSQPLLPLMLLQFSYGPTHLFRSQTIRQDRPVTLQPA